MAKSNAIWGIDIGQCALKALRCVPGNSPERITADAFDFIEYPKILSQPEADPVELIRDALQQFLSRNNVKGDRVAISVSGQSGLSRFIKLPPVESKKIPNIVKYEARQQIPFALEDVVWDYQQMAGGSEEEGFALETEVGLFAMKRDQVFRALRPFDQAGIEVDIIQLTPIALYNYVAFDQLQDLPPVDQYDPEDPPPSILVLSLGTDTTDLVVTNGYRVWQRSVPLGGNHFTKALTKELKLTFAKAEHLKRNAMKAEDPKAVFQAMRPVFTDLVTEVQRSISFFGSIDRKARVEKVVALGNAMKLRGLQSYLQQHLGYELVPIEAYRGLAGTSVVDSPAFKDNILSYGVCYGLCVQGLGEGRLSTNLLPPEIVKDRLIREKKPWAVAAVAALLVGCSVGFVGHWLSWNSVHDSHYASAYQAAEGVASQSATAQSEFDSAKQRYQAVKTVGDHLAGLGERRLLWPELMKAVNLTLPRDEVAAGQPPDQETPIEQRNRIYVDSLDCEHMPDLAQWFGNVRDMWQRDRRALGKDVPEADAAVDAVPIEPQIDPNTGLPIEAAGGGGAGGPSGPGWVVQISGHHYHNSIPGNSEAQFVRRTLMTNLEELSVELPGPDRQTMVPVPLKDLGVSSPVIIEEKPAYDYELADPNPAAIDPVMNVPLSKSVRRFDFILQFAWQPTTVSERLEMQRQRAEQERAAALAAAAAAADNPGN